MHTGIKITLMKYCTMHHNNYIVLIYLHKYSLLFFSRLFKVKYPPLHCQILNLVAGVVGALNVVPMPNLSGTSLHPLARLEALA
jgi:hypothetical protein